MSNANNAHFWQVDHQIKHIEESSHTLVIPSPQAWQDYQWTRQYFQTEPQEGYFIWVKEQPTCALISCVSVSKNKVDQQMSNLLVVEPGLNIELSGTCNSLEENLDSSHNARGKIVLKKGCQVNYAHIHTWGEMAETNTDYYFVLEEGAKLEYVYSSKYPPKRLSLQTKFDVAKNARAMLTILADLADTNVKLHDTMFLTGANAAGISKLRLIGRKNSRIRAYSKIIAQAAGVGHLECDGLMLDPSANISLIPELGCQHPNAKITHEASIGKIADEQLNYLRTRGLTSDQALDLIVAGFLRQAVS